MIKLNGLNKRTVAFDKVHVLFLEECEINGDLVTNVHFSNGKWITTAHSLNEVEAAMVAPELSEAEEAVDKAHSQKELTRWREMAKARREIQIEIDEELRKIGPKLRSKSYQKETLADGSGKLTILYEPAEHEGPDTDT